MSILDKLKANVERVKEQELENKKGSKTDLRFLNYYDLDTNKDQSIVVRFLPINEFGDVFETYTVHTSNIRGANTIRCCYESSGESCPVCTKSYEAYQNGDKEVHSRYNKSSKIVAQVVVVDSDIPVNQAEDGNMVKLMYVPHGIAKEVKKAVNNGLVTDITGTNFVIKRSMGSNKRANYDDSFFNPGLQLQVPEEFEKSFIDGISYIYDMSEIVPKPSTTEECQEWLDKVDSLYAKRLNESDSSGSAQTTSTNENDILAALGGNSGSATTKPVDEKSDDKEPASETVDGSDDLLALLNRR